jgi:hypothetical protein
MARLIDARFVEDEFATNVDRLCWVLGQGLIEVVVVFVGADLDAGVEEVGEVSGG